MDKMCVQAVGELPTGHTWTPHQDRNEEARHHLPPPVLQQGSFYRTHLSRPADLAHQPANATRAMSSSQADFPEFFLHAFFSLLGLWKHTPDGHWQTSDTAATIF